jgi:hypothetical protein
MTLKNAVTKGVKAWRDRRVGYWLCIDPKTGEYYLLTSATEAEEKEAVKYLRARNYTHFKLSKQCALKR